MRAVIRIFRRRAAAIARVIRVRVNAVAIAAALWIGYQIHARNHVRSAAKIRMRKIEPGIQHGDTHRARAQLLRFPERDKASPARRLPSARAIDAIMPLQRKERIVRQTANARRLRRR